MIRVDRENDLPLAPSENKKEVVSLNHSLVYLLALISILLPIYFLTYNGKFITDDEQIFASRALSQAFDPLVNVARMLGNSRIFAYTHLDPQYAIPATNVEPMIIFIGAILVKISDFLHLGHVQFLFTLNIWVTLITILILYLCIIQMGYPVKLSFWVSLLFAMATIVWPYSRSLFRDPLAMLFTLLAWYFFLRFSQGNGHERKLSHRVINLILFVLFLTLGTLSKNTVLLLLPVCGFAFLFNNYEPRHLLSKSIDRSNLSLTMICLSVGVFAFLIIQFLAIKYDQFSRFSVPYYNEIFKNILVTHHPQFLVAFLGTFFSPGKSILLYSPILFLSLAGLIRHFRKTWSLWLFTILLVSAQALVYDTEWWGHINWGLRYILPAMPLLVLAGLPVISSMAESNRGRIGLIIIALISISIQLLGVLAPLKKYYIGMAVANPPISAGQMIWSFQYSPLVWSIKWLFSGGILDLAIMRLGLVGLTFIILFSAIIISTFRVISRKSNSGTISLLFLFSIAFSMAFTYFLKTDPDNKPIFLDQVIESLVTNNLQPRDLVLIDSYGTSTWDYWMNWSRPGTKWESLPYFSPSPEDFEAFKLHGDPNLALEENSKTILSEAMTNQQRIWLVVGDDAPKMGSIVIYSWLMENSGLIKKWSIFGDNGSATLYLFSEFPNR